MIEVKNLTKKINKINIIEDVSIDFKDGNIYGIVGRNGCGKSVFLKLLSSLIYPSSGSIVIDSKEVSKNGEFTDYLRAIINAPKFINSVSGKDNMIMLADIQNKVAKEEIEDTFKLFKIEKYMDEKVQSYSLGTMQKLGLVSVFMEKPKIIILDEIFEGLDKEYIEYLIKLLKREKEKNHIVILTSHDKDILDKVCDQIYKLDSGKLTSVN